MNRSSLYETYGDDDDDEEDDIDFEDIRRACMVSDANSDQFAAKTNSIEADGDGGEAMPSDSENEDDFEMLRSIRSQLPSSKDAELSSGPPVGLSLPSDSESEDDFEMIRSITSQLALSMDVPIPPIGLSDDDDDEDGAFETLRVIRRRFSAYANFDTEGNFMNDSAGKKKQVHDSDNEPSREILSRSNTCESFPDHGKSIVTVPDSEDVQDGHSADVHEITSAEPHDHLETSQLSLMPGSSTFPEAAQAFVDAIRKNRAYQKFLRRKLEVIEATIEQNEKHKKNVKIVKDFQASCKRITKLALVQRKDPRVELISTRKSVPCDSSEGNDKKTSPLLLGPPENPCVADYRMALEKYPVSVERRKWSTEENKNLAKGLKQEVQKILLYEAIEQSSDLEGSTYDIDAINESIRNLEITPEMIRQFLPKINWDSLDIKDRSAAECEARWMSSEDPLINHGPWTEAEDKNLLRIIEEKGLTDWLDIAVSLGTNRTPFQCLARYQRSLNASILKKEWTAEEDDQLRGAVELFGDKDWQSVANVLKGRTGPQCSNRWKKSLRPTRKGRWSLEEDKRVKVAVTLFGSQNWHKISQFVPGRTATQCRERWVNCLEPNLNRGKWTKEEDEKLREAIAKHGYSWSKVASDLSCRTDNQCLRRWKTLYPHQVALLQEARRLRKEAIVGNFVDRESERPALVTGAILALPNISLEPEPVSVALKKKGKAKRKKSDAERQPKRRRKGLEKCSGDVCRQENETVCENEPNNGGEGRLLEVEPYNEIQDIGEEKQRRRRKRVAATANNTTGLKKLTPKRRKVSAVVPIKNQDAPN
ncbi:PREDICTED: snRNA-activating protein complex subunit 4-like isoform X2 [Camelina sativa]|uniref:snRNA-activating protein complex subunit 4-like isoform X2 n=1 Tax=Camelina sativa TaxID=90675 RepID=A0ABM0YVB1_CAMSA|nr:PREDICTED: snRNA-activating protein complex subunit 4-like isoform X2 [Camelina sativa]